MDGPLLGALLLLASLGAAGCGRGGERELHPLAEAYRLMDRGDNAAAILVLENYLEGDPGSIEGRKLLASAYVGHAGADLYRLFDSFKDLLFKKPLGGTLWGGREPAPRPAPGSAPGPEPGAGPPPGTTRMRELLARVDGFLSTLGRVLSLIGRFPDVPRPSFVFLDEALARIDGLDIAQAGKDVALYRVFARVIYLKSRFTAEILDNPRFGSREWGCELELPDFRESLGWASRHLDTALADFASVFPERSPGLVALHASIAAVAEELDRLEREAPPGTGSALSWVQEELRHELGCANPQG